MVKKTNQPKEKNSNVEPSKITKPKKTKQKNSKIEILNKDSVEIIENQITATFDVTKIDKSTTVFEREDISNFLNANQITISGDDKFTPMFTFASTDFPKDILQKLEIYEYPTPIQSLSWPIVTKKNNVVSIAKTGSGKTLAFVVPAIIHARKRGPLKDDEGPVVSTIINLTFNFQRFW